MLSFRQLDDLPEPILSLLEDVQNQLIGDMARRIGNLHSISEATEYQLFRAEALVITEKELRQKLAKALRLSEKALLALFDEAATRSLEQSERVTKLTEYTPVPLHENQWLQQIIRAGYEKTRGSFENLTRTTAKTATKQFEQALDLAWGKMTSGGFDYQSAIKQGIRQLTQNGMASIRYPSGHIDYVDVAFRRAALTGVNQTVAELQVANAQELGTDFVEVTAHPGARPDHALWQGKIYSISGKSEKYPPLYPSTGLGTGAGLCGWNCRHSFFPYFEGISEETYSASKLREYNNKQVEYNGKPLSIYDASQVQRSIERNIRRYKREAFALESAGLDSKAKRKVRDWQARQRDFIKQTRLTRDYFRERGGIQIM